MEVWASLAVGFVFLLAAAGCEKDYGAEVPEVVDFNYHVKPILSNNCFLCHGPDVSTRKANLRLDTREGALASGDDGAAVVRGDEEASLLVKRILSEELDYRMPPDSVSGPLTASEIAILRKWIDDGAEYRPHWALIPPESGRVPDSPSAWNPESDIDRFVHASLNAAALEPSAEATSEQLMRRLSFVLTGLPPTEDQLGRIDDVGYETVVDEMLASPQFGERWARHWMDLVRYADTKGHEFDYGIDGAWQYRDYLIRAFNSSVPYNQMVREHLAGDLLPEPRVVNGIRESEIATAYMVLGEGTHSPVDLRQDAADRIDNIIDVTTKTFQALTVACARCHDHKFDPIPTTDYYALYGVFESTRFAPRFIASHASDDQLTQLDERRQVLHERVGEHWRASASKTPISRVSMVQGVDSTGNGGAVDTIYVDFRSGSLFDWKTEGPAFSGSGLSWVLAANEDSTSISDVVKTGLSSRTNGPGFYGALRSPTFELATDSVAILAAGKHSMIRLVVNNFQLIRNPIYGDLEIQFNSDEPTIYKMGIDKWRGLQGYFEVMSGTYAGHSYQPSDSSWFDIQYITGYNNESTGRLPESNAKPSLDESIAAFISGSPLPGADGVIRSSLATGRIDPDVPGLKESLELIKQTARSIKRPDYYSGITDGDALDSPVFIRGSFQTKSEDIVPRRFLTAIEGGEQPFDSKGSGRLEMAELIASPDNPLTARVMVNRLWHHVFGRGIVESVDNFGGQGKLPSHPYLLDHLAVQFVESDWSVKVLLKEMVMSATFRQASTRSQDALAQDPENILLSGYPVRRLEAEAIRDAILAVSGSLDLTMYGPPVDVYLTQFMTGRGRPKKSGPLDGYGRRSIYQKVLRNFLSPFMLTFDAPIPFSSFGKRNTSNVPAQSLTMMNDPLVVQKAGEMAQRLLDGSASAQDRIQRAYRLAFGREPIEDELQDGLAFIRSQADERGLSENDKAIWTDFCHTLFNLKEFIHLI